MQYRTSRYSFAFPVVGGVLLYNANSGATLKLTGNHAEQLGELLGAVPTLLDSEWFGPALLTDLLGGGFLLEQHVDELQVVRDRYWKARLETPFVLTITTTMDCNLGCYYCYEERSTEELKLDDVASVVKLVRERIDAGYNSIHVDWYGGEPLLNVEFLEAASKAIQEFCAQRTIAYSASVISNGTCWPEDVGSFVGRHKIRQVQISFDGLREHHNRRRRYRKPGEGKSSFDIAVRLVDKLLDHTRVDLRFNIDQENQDDLLPFTEFARERGWFDRKHEAVIQPARLASYSEKSAFMRSSEIASGDYEALRNQVRTAINGDTTVEESEVPDGYPSPRTSVCAALADASVVVGADSNLYRCGLQVGEKRRSVDQLKNADALLPVIQNARDAEFWDTFDPTTAPKCSECSFLPICWGGCPKKHLECDRHALDEQSQYWRVNLPRLVTRDLGVSLRQANLTVSESEQFRDRVT